MNNSNMDGLMRVHDEVIPVLWCFKVLNKIKYKSLFENQSIKLTWNISNDDQNKVVINNNNNEYNCNPSRVIASDKAFFCNLC